MPIALSWLAESTEPSRGRAMKSRFVESYREVCESHGWELLPTGVVVHFGDGRKQLVSFEHFEFENEELVRLVSVIGPADSMTHEELASALRSNADIAHGALAIREGELVLVDTLLIQGLDSAALAAAIEFLATSADNTERVAFGTDAH
jgi:hypothetical protein